MKRPLIILAFFTLTMSSCFTYTCPTYAKKNPKMIELEKQQEIAELARIKNSI